MIVSRALYSSAVPSLSVRLRSCLAARRLVHESHSVSHPAAASTRPDSLRQRDRVIVRGVAAMAVLLEGRVLCSVRILVDSRCWAQDPTANALAMALVPCRHYRDDAPASIQLVAIMERSLHHKKSQTRGFQHLVFEVALLVASQVVVEAGAVEVQVLELLQRLVLGHVLVANQAQYLIVEAKSLKVVWVGSD